jgi:hypothetical protein
MRYRVATGITIAIALLSIALVPACDFWLPIGMAAAAAIGLVWAIAFRLRIVTGAFAGLVIGVLTPAMDEPLLGRAIVFVVFGSLAGICWKLLVTSWPKLKT